MSYLCGDTQPSLPAQSCGQSHSTCRSSSSHTRLGHVTGSAVQVAYTGPGAPPVSWAGRHRQADVGLPTPQDFSHCDWLRAWPQPEAACGIAKYTH